MATKQKESMMSRVLTAVIGGVAGILGGYLIWGRDGSIGAVRRLQLQPANTLKLKNWASIASQWASALLQVHPPVTPQPWHACRVRLKSLLQFASKVETTIYTSANDVESDRDKLLVYLKNAKNAVGVSGPPLPLW